jgi:SGNH domain (fused to AT3 domains)
VLINPQSYFPGWWGAWVCGGTYLLIDAGQTSWFNRRALSSAPLVWLGRISYPLYLWHWPLLSFSFIVIGTPSVGFRLGILLLSVALAWLTNILLERPLQRRLIVTRLTHGALRLVAAMVLIAMIGVLVKYALVEPVSARDPKDVAIGSAKADRVAVEEEVIPGTVGHTTLFFGDSHMQQYWPRIEYLVQQPVSRRTAELKTMGGCAPIPLIERDLEPSCLDFVNAGFARAAQADVDVVVIASSWEGFTERGDYYRPGVRGAKYLDVMAPENQWIFDGFSDAVRHLCELGKRVVVLTSSPRDYGFDPGHMLDRTRIIPRYRQSAPVSLASLKTWLRPIDGKIRQAALRAGAEVVDPDPWMCDTTVCPAVDDKGHFLYSDETHIRAAAAQARAVGMDQYIVLGRTAAR